MKDENLTRISKFLSLILRHDPGRIGLALDAQGWASVEELIARAGEAGCPLTRSLIERIVSTNDKRRFAISTDRRLIRANQGHSIAIDHGLPTISPPETLYHGTATRFLASIRRRGLVPGDRLHVHLSSDETTALAVGRRHGRPVVLNVRSGAMHAAGLAFYRSENGVWLTDRVPPEFVGFPDGEGG